MQNLAGSLKGRYFFEDLSVGGRIILKMILKQLCLEGVEWIHPAQDREQWL
jgi:hypothetical protein